MLSERWPLHKGWPVTTEPLTPEQLRLLGAVRALVERVRVWYPDPQLVVHMSPDDVAQFGMPMQLWGQPVWLMPGWSSGQYGVTIVERTAGTCNT